MNFGIFITCRNGSKRLPGKCNLQFTNRMSYIEYIFQRSFKVKQKCTRVLCTTKNRIDLNLVKIAKKFKINSYRGNTQDKLNRWQNAAKKFNIDFFVTVDGDDPLFDPQLIDKAFKQYKKNKSDFIEGSALIPGLFTYGIKTKALNTVCKIKNTKDTEMMSVYFTDTGLFKCEKLTGVNKNLHRDDIRLTLDYPEDHFFFKSLVENFKSKKKFFNTNEIMKILKKKPELIKINSHRIKEWKNNQFKNTKLLLK